MTDRRPADDRTPLDRQLDRVVALLRGRDPTIVTLVILIVLLGGGFSIALPDRFPTLRTLEAMAFQMPELGLLALAMTVPLMSGGLNLAIIATANLSGLAMAYVLTVLLAPEAGGMTLALVIALAVVVGLVVCAVVGLINGVITAYVGVHPILVTLGTMTLINGIAVWLTRGATISGFPDAILFLGNGTLLGVPMPMIVFLICAGLLHVILTRTPFGVAVFMIGSNEQATRYSGVDTRRVLVGVYVLSSVLCCVAALIMMARFNSARAGYAESYLLVTILAAVLGGVDPFGGFGRILGLVLALFILQMISSGFNLLGVRPHLTPAIWGGILILVMATGFLKAQGRLLWGRFARRLRPPPRPPEHPAE